MAILDAIKFSYSIFSLKKDGIFFRYTSPDKYSVLKIISFQKAEALITPVTKLSIIIYVDDDRKYISFFPIGILQ